MCEECTKSVTTWDNLKLPSCSGMFGLGGSPCCFLAKNHCFKDQPCGQWQFDANHPIDQYFNIEILIMSRQIQTYSYMMWGKKTYADLTVQNIRTPLSTSWSSSLRRSWRQIAWHQKPGGGIGDRLWDLREISSVWAEASHVFECLRCMKMLKLLGISTARLDGSHGVVCKKNTFDPGIELPQARAGHAKPF